jgi:hypothetical protein
MSLQNWAGSLEFRLQSTLARPDGVVSLPLDGRELLRRSGLKGAVDWNSLRVVEANFPAHNQNGRVQESHVAVHWVPAPGFHPERNPVGTLHFRLWKMVWEEPNWSRDYRLLFDVLQNGQKPQPDVDREWLTPLWLRANHAEDGRSAVEIGTGATLLTRFAHPAGRKPAFDVLTTPDGRVLTASRPRDHVWHRGLWFAWTKITSPGLDLPSHTFWIEPHVGVIHDGGVSNCFAGPLVAGFTHRSTWCAPTGEAVFDAALQARMQGTEGKWLWLDLDLTLTAERDFTLDTDYGHLAARANLALQNTFALAGSGEHLHTARDDEPAPWSGFAGELDGRAASLLLLGAKDNPGAVPARDLFHEPRTFSLDENDLFLKVSHNPIRPAPVAFEAGESRTWRHRVVTATRLLDEAFANVHHHNFIEALQPSGALCE